MTIYHKHHIIPRHAGGTDSPDNIVSLTVKEHAEAHRLLFESFGRWQDLYAWRGLSGQINMSEEIKTEEGWSTIKKTIIGAITTAITAGGAYLTSTLVGGDKEEHKEEAKTEQTSPASATPVVINVQQSQENKQQVKQGGGTNTIIKERVVEKPATPATKPEPKDEEPW